MMLVKNKEDLLSVLWIFLAVNYLFCDVFSLYQAKFLNQLLTGSIDGIEFSEQLLFYFAIMMELPILMIVLSKLLKPMLNRIVTIVVSILMIVIQLGSLITGKNSLHYLFFSIIEITTLLFIMAFAWDVSKKTPKKLYQL